MEQSLACPRSLYAMLKWIKQIALLSASGAVPVGLVGAGAGCSGSGMLDFSNRSLDGVVNATATVASQAGPVGVRYYLAGDPAGRRVVMVHGTPGSAAAWRRYLDDPMPGLETVALDRPGWGGSNPGAAEPSLIAQAAALEPLLVTRTGADGETLKPILVGHSLGGPIIARAAIDYPDRVGAIVIIAGSMDPDLERVLFVQHVGEFLFVPALLPAWLRTTNRELLPLEQELETLRERLGEITCPVLIIHGTEDSLVSFENVAYMQKMFTAARVEVLTFEGDGHMLPWTHAAQLREAIARLAAAALEPSRRPAESLPSPG